MAGAFVAAAPTFLLTRAWYQRAALKAELKLGNLNTALAEERAEKFRLSQQISATVLEDRDALRNKLDGVAADLTRVAERVQVCARQSDVRVTLTPAGTIEAVHDEQLRSLADAVRDFATACAIGRDRDNADHNALVDWLEQIRRDP